VLFGEVPVPDLKFLPDALLYCVSFVFVFTGCCSPSYPTFELYDAHTNRKNQDLKDDQLVCVPFPHNIKASFCRAPRTHPVQLKLSHENCTTLKRQNAAEAPYFLWGNKGPDVLPNTWPLPKGGSYLYTKVDGVTRRIRFRQCCDFDVGCPVPTFEKRCSMAI
jgi:hypothetical protein